MAESSAQIPKKDPRTAGAPPSGRRGGAEGPGSLRLRSAGSGKPWKGDVHRLAAANSAVSAPAAAHTEAVVRVVLIYLLPIDVMVGVSAALMITTFVLLILWTVSGI